MQSNQNNPAIEFYIAQGYTLFPLRGKIPPKGYRWANAQFNPLATAADFPSGNFGVKLSAEDLVVDIDPRNFPKDNNPLEAFQTAIQTRLKGSTFTVKTGGGGLHLYYKKSAELAIRGALKEYPGIDFKSKGGYVVGAGSIHPDTLKEYTIYHQGPVNPAPPVLLELLRKLEMTPIIGTAVYSDDEQTKSRFIQYLKTAPIAIEGESGDKATFAVSAVARDFALSPDVAFSLMLDFYNNNCIPPWHPDDLKRKVYNAYQYAGAAAGTRSGIDKFGELPPINATVSDFRMRDGKIQKSVYNTVTAFNVDCAGMIAFNIFSEDIVFLKPAPWHRPGEKQLYWTDEETARAVYYWGKERHFEPTVQMIEAALINVSGQQSFHPIKKYIESAEWDGFKRLHNWTTTYCGVEDTAYSRAVGIKTLVAAVTRIYHPGHKFDYIPVLEGKQGLGKSRAVAVLGGEWYGDLVLDVHNKDTVDAMRRLWIIEVSEMETQFRTQTQALKSFLSRSEDICRLAYGRRSKTFPRHNIFIGTINPENDSDMGWLQDTTGNRRYWPLLCTAIDIDALRKVRDQLWAEAYLYYREATALHFEDTAVEEQAAIEQKKREGKDPWHDSIAEWVDNDVMKTKDVISSNDVFQSCLGGRATSFTRANQNRIALVMSILGWEKGLFYCKDAGKGVRGYKRPEAIG